MLAHRAVLEQGSRLNEGLVKLTNTAYKSSTLRQTTIAKGNPPFEGVSPFKNGGFPLLCYVYQRVVFELYSRMMCSDMTPNYIILHSQTVRGQKKLGGAFKGFFIFIPKSWGK